MDFIGKIYKYSKLILVVLFFLFLIPTVYPTHAAECVGCNSDSNYVGRNDYNGSMPSDEECKKTLCNPCGGGTCWTHDDMGNAGCECQQPGNKAWCESKGVCCNGGTRVPCGGQTPTSSPDNNLPCTTYLLKCSSDAECKAGGSKCQNYFCAQEVLSKSSTGTINTDGLCYPDTVPPPCNITQMGMFIDKTTVVPGDVVRFSFDPDPSQNYVQQGNKFEPSDAVDCEDMDDKPRCKIMKRPSYPVDIRWTHYWRNCAKNGSCNTLSKECSYTMSIKVNDPGNPPPKACGGNFNPVSGVCETAIGPFSVASPELFIKQIFSVILVIGGVGALGLIVYSGYLFMLSRGDKQKVQSARDSLTAAISGLIFIILSMAILEFVGVDLLKIPGWWR